MDGRLSMEKAKKIKEEREFAEELKAIGADAGVQERESRGSRSGLQRKRTGGSAESSEDESEEQEPQPAAKKVRI
jgi:Ran GTPase-activating protein (RanGAP) involved in mRNA processing and transport